MSKTNFSSVADIQNAIIVTKSDLSSLRSAIKYNLNKMKELKTSLSEIKQVAKLQKSVDAAEKAKAREAKREIAIERARAKLEKLLAKPVGSAAKKASRKPSAVTVLRAA
jgi:regulator of replication initiation timing